ncbi:MAG: glycosyltransferase [Pyrobaculum sp.]
MAQSLLVRPDLAMDSAGGFLNFLDYPIELKTAKSLSPYEVQYAKGAAALIRVSAYRAVGGFDPRFFYYYDETDLCARFRRAGYRVVVVPKSIVFHVGQGSKIPNKEYFILYYMERNRPLYMYK